MAHIVNMPRLSDTMTEGVVAKWLIQVGDTVQEGDILAEIETDKATMEFESFYSGVVLYKSIEEGETIPVDALLTIIGEKDEDISSIVSSGNTPAETASSTKEKTETPNINPALAEKIITMPRLSDTMTEGTVAKWVKQVGDTVQEGDILAEIETDKATMEFESFYSGTLLYQGVKEGESAPIDSPLAIVGESGDDVEAILASFGSSVSKPTEEDTPTPNTKKESPATPPSTSGERIFASPLAKKMAAANHIDISAIKGSGENGRIVKADIELALKQGITTSSTETAPTTHLIPSGEDRIEKNSQMRKTIARRLTESKNSAPHYYLKTTIEMDNLMAIRKQINASGDVKISFNDFVIKAVSMALRKHPAINSSWDGDQIIYRGNINVGVAVAVEDGLLVPVIRNSDHKGMHTISQEVKQFAKAARDKKLQPKDWEGSTFTISNLGMFDVEEFTSIINQPDSCILSVGSIKQLPVVRDNQIVVGHEMKLNLACDHRTVDGATGALFLQTLKTYLENPTLMLV